MWRAGYCKDTIEFAKTTTNDSEGSARRIHYLEAHVRKCQDCLFANALKEIEGITAQHMGVEAVDLFVQGQNITTLPAFRYYFGPIMAAAFKTHPVFSTRAGQLWLLQQAERAGENYG